MRDLLGDHIKPLLNATHGFADFWAAWPRGPRKVAKSQCLAKWVRLGCAANAGFIVAHVQQMTRSPEWLGGFIPMPLTYLNQARWEGETLESLDNTSRKAVEAMGEKAGLGRWNELEQWPVYQARVLAASARLTPSCAPENRAKTFAGA